MVKVDRDKYDISKNNLFINADDHLVLIAASTTIKHKNISLPVNDISLGEGKSYSLLRNWAVNNTSGNASGTITTHECHMTCKWGNLTNPPANDNDCDQNLIPISSPNSSLQKVHELDEIFKSRSDNYDVVLITFCGNNSTNSKVEFNITEPLPIPNKNAATIIYASQQEIVVPKTEYQLYIDTRHIVLSSEEDYGEPVKIELQQANERDELIIIISSVGGGMLVLFLFVLILAIVAFICFFTLRRNNLFSLGIAYRNNNNI